ncbi:ead/Ea22-like family protein [Salmonella enterica subsp. enterica serovar Gatineau]|uniref:ead/Ea22-like family protein n=1 Tax=Salmonella enterica TaxID=28901 RepID=UPI002867A3A2|nr:ead/Ea22-like family protein [Salmonella enterica]MDR7936729.1 ead/Ea22-like family protein [Salmonella enterica subsp. enterica serovar Gatineau]
MNKKEEIKAVIQQAVVAFNHWNQMTTLEKIYFPEREPLLFKEHARVMDQFFAHFTPASALELLDELEKAQRQIVNFQQSCENDPRIHEIIDLKELIAELDKRLIEYAGIATREARRVAELEARTVTPPKNNVANVGDSRWMWYQRDLMWIEAIRAAGIKVIEGEGQ